MNVKVFYGEKRDWFGNPIPRTVTLNGKRAKRVRFGKRSPTGDHGGYSKTAVFFTDDYVIKFGQINEASIEFDKKDRKHFAEVVYADINKQWYVQKRVDCVPNAEVTEKQYDLVQRLGRKYKIWDLHTQTSGKYVRGTNYLMGLNWTVDKNGIPVIFDYAGVKPRKAGVDRLNVLMYLASSRVSINWLGSGQCWYVRLND
jgi:hypothetical protein